METTMNKPQPKALICDKTKQVLVDIIIYLYVALFFYTATSKLMDYDKSELQMSKSPIITDYSHILVWLVPVTEIIIGLLLVIPKTVLNGLYAALMLMVLFTVYIYSILNFSSYVPCSCGGVLQNMSWQQHFIFNVVFIVFAIVGIYLKLHIRKTTRV
ncbi:DoxX family protein [Pedobacter africanus]|uniref:Uncharacterized membrane protein YphA, DoxX/SURF4 family n=1 Tax=Pedobacter africanus TaxID=151894 RepID=A0A1W2DI22_9SPHI|nr:DoxX family protein [Pedobacter africanus]SMC97113.1 Uncharacterized membrane protein YphA, DoxX/SURF4 family [Pedobacter africanus]